MKTILILDANSLFNRAFYGVRPLSTRDGLPTNAVFGYINVVKKHLDAIRPHFAVAAFDLHAPTFRHKFDPAYKANRKGMPEELSRQLPYLRRATQALGLAIVEKEGFEADDILGTLSRIAGEGGDRAVLVTGDRDSYQLVSDHTTLILAGTHKDEEITPEVIREKFGLTPRQMIDVKALAGDSSDNIPGVRGIGEKTALKLIGEKGDLDGVYADPDTLPLGPSAKEKIASGKEDAYRSRFLAEICRDVPELGPIENYSYTGIVPALLRPLLIELEFSKMLHTFGLEGDVATDVDPTDLQGSLFDLIPEEPVEILPKDALQLKGKLLFLDFDQESFYAHDGENVWRLEGDVEALLRASSPVVCDYKAYLHRFADAFGPIRGVGASFDLFLAAYVLNSQDSAPNLSRLALSYLKESAPPDLSASPATRLSLMARLYPVLKEAIEDSSARDLYYQIELPLSYVLAKMEIRGFQVDRAGIIRYGEKLEEAIKETERKIFDLAGEKFLINSPKQLGHILFEKLSLPPGKKTKTGFATDAETLDKLRPLSPIIGQILDYRAFSKLHSTYVLGLLSQIHEDGRIHTVFNQTLTATGRLSSAEPNLQNIPVKTELGREMRKFFTAKDEGYLLVDADYSQIELRLLAHISKDAALKNFFLAGRDIHTQTASEIFHVPEEAVTPEMRKSAKAINFGIVYGIGEYSLSQDLGVSMRVAKEYIEKTFALFPQVRSYLDRVKKEAHETGFVQTLFGRKRQIPELKSSKKPLVAFGERVAMNTPIQGTAADIIKLAMVRVDRRLEQEGLESALVLQVHDELILEVPKSEADYAARLLSEEMEGAVQYAVPLIAQANVGFTWYDTK